MITKIRLLSNPQNLTTVVSSSGLTTVVKKQELLVTTVSSGIIGPRGPSVGEVLERTSQVTIAGHRAVISTGNDEVGYASNDIEDHQFRVIGITTNAASPGFPIEIRQFGEITEPSWSFSVGPVYLGVNGQLTQTIPVSPALFALIVGYAISFTTIVVNIQTPINIG